MRILRIWYGLVIIWFSRLTKNTARLLGEKLKILGRWLIVRGEDRTPRWNRELFYQCFFAETEIHLSDGVYCGTLTSIYQKSSGKKRILVIVLDSVVRKQSFCPKGKVLGTRDFELTEYGAPVIIKDGRYDCVWASCRDGYVAIYFSRPIKELTY